MPRRRTSKQQQAVQQKRRQARRNNLFIVIGGVIVVAVIAVVILIAQNNRPVDTASTSVVSVEKQEWPQADGSAMGPADAAVVVREFSDYQCPFCRQFDQTVQKQIVSDYVATGKVRFEYHHYIIIDRNVGGTESRKAAEASECAADQGQFWNYHEMLFANQQGEGTGGFSDARLKLFAEKLGLDTAKFNSCFDARRFRAKVTTDEAMGTSLGINGTPSLFVNNKKVENPVDYASVKAAIDAALAGTAQ